MLPIRASEGHPGYPGPTRNRALAHQGETDLFADGLPKYRTGLRSNSFIQSGSASQHRSQLAMTGGADHSSISDVHVLDRLDKIFLELLHHGAGGFDAVDQADALADEITSRGREPARCRQPPRDRSSLKASRLMMLASGIGSAHGAVRPRSQRVGPHRAQLPRSACRCGPWKRTASREDAAIYLLAEDFGGFGLDGRKPHPSRSGAGRAHRHRGRHLPPGHTMPPAASTGTSRIGLIAFDHLGHQHHGRHVADSGRRPRCPARPECRHRLRPAAARAPGANECGDRNIVLLTAHVDHGLGWYARARSQSA